MKPVQQFKGFLRTLMLDRLGRREDRYYWRQPQDSFTLPQRATVCLWQPDGKLGDAVIHTRLVALLHRQRPDVRLLIVCAAPLQSFWLQVPGVWQVMAAPSARQAAQAVRALMGADRLAVFVSLETFASIDTLRFMHALEPLISVGFGVGHYKAFDYALADHTYMHPRRHVSERLAGLCELMGLAFQAGEKGLDMAALAAARCTTKVRLDTDRQAHLFLNVHGAGPQRVFTADTVAWLMGRVQAQWPGCHIVLSAPDAQRQSLAAHLRDQVGQGWSLAPQGMSTWELIALMQQCHAVVTPDTAIGHIAAALDLPVTVFFADAHYNPVVWRPMGDQVQVVRPTAPGNVNQFDPVQAEAALAAMRAAAQAVQPAMPDFGNRKTGSR